MHTSTDTAFTKIHAQNIEIFKMVCAQAKTDMSVAEIDHLIGNLFEIKEMKAAANSTNAKRLERMQATKGDPKFDTIRAKVDAELKQLGLVAPLSSPNPAPSKSWTRRSALPQWLTSAASS
jgi:hypothetical protein